MNARRQFGEKKGTVVGSDRGTTTLTGPRSARVNAVATLPGGTISVRGRIQEQTDATLVVPVVGGTGSFAGARGTLTINGTEKRAWNVYRLTYPLRRCLPRPTTPGSRRLRCGREADAFRGFARLGIRSRGSPPALQIALIGPWHARRRPAPPVTAPPTHGPGRAP